MSLDVLTLAAAKKYTDSQRIAHEEVERAILLPKKEITLESKDDFGGVLGWEGKGSENEVLKVLELLAQHKDVVFVTEVNGQVYKDVYSDDMFVDGCIVIGNQALMGVGDDTGEPFLFILATEGIGLIYENPNSLANMSITASLTLKAETIHQIDPKFIPLPYSVVNLTNPVPTENLTEIELSEADVEALNKAAVADKPVLFKFTYGEGMKATAFAEVVTADEGFTQFTVAIHMMAFQILSINVFYEEGNWNGWITLYSAMDAATTEET